MHKRRIPYLILGIAVCMLVIVCWFLFKDSQSLLERIQFKETIYGLDMEPYYDESEDIYYLFIPSYAKPDDIQIDGPNSVTVHLADEKQDYGDALGEVPLSQDITLTLSNFYQKETYTFQVLQCENLPTVYVETESGSMDYVNEDKTNEEDATVVVIDEDGTIKFSGLSAITGRGNTTWWEGAKKPYNLKFDEMTNFIGTEEAMTWCLLANYSDNSQIGNALSFYTARQMGIPYTSDIYFVSLYINGEYLGLYNIATKQGYYTDIDSPIKAVFEKADEYSSYNYITDNNTYIRFRYGDEDYIKTIVDSLEDKLLGEEDVPYKEICQYIDISSFARKYLVEDFVANGDNRKSQCYAIDEAGKIVAICAWDYDLTFGILYNEYLDASYNYRIINHTWYTALFKYDEFREELVKLLNDYSNLLQNMLPRYMDNLCAWIENDWDVNAVRWGNEAPYHSGGTALRNPNYNFVTLKEYQIYINNFIQQRYLFLDDYYHNPDAFCKLTFSDNTICNISVYCARDAVLEDDMLPDGLLTIPLDGFDGWYTEDGISITDVETVTEDMTFQGIWEPGKDTARMDDQSNGDNPIIVPMKKIYQGLGLDSFGIGRLAVCGLFSLALLALLCGEVIRWIRQRRNEP